VKLISLVVHRPVATWMIAIATAVFGLVSYERLPLNLMPDLSYPTITVRTEVEGYAPEEVESQISRPVEAALATTAGLAEIESRSRAGLSDVVLEFSWGTDMGEAAQDARERLQTTFLPDDAKRPLLLRYDPSHEPIMRVALAIDTRGMDSREHIQALLDLRDLADNDLKRKLEAIDGVAAVRVRGGLEREVRVELREDWLAARELSLAAVVATLEAENINLPGGLIREGDHEYLVRTLGEVRTVEEIEQLQVRRDDGRGVAIRELAVVSETYEDPEVISRLDGELAVELEIFKSAEANIVQVSRKVHRRLGTDRPEGGGMEMGPSIQDGLPEGVQLAVLEDQSRFVEASLVNLRSTAILGGLLAIIVLFLFLKNLRSTAIIGAAIPLSIIVSFAPMYMGGVSLNLMSLGGLALGMGMLVDNGVVVLENIQVKLEEGMARRQAAIEGTQEVAAAVIASTLTTVSVFLPIAFVEGVAGQLFGDLALAVVFSLLASLVVALFFVPMLAASEIGTEPEAVSLGKISRAARFRSFSQLKQSFRTRSWVGRILLSPYWLLRLVTRFSLELLAALIVWPTALLFRLLSLLLGWVIRPVFGGIAGAAATGFNLVYGALVKVYGRALNGVLRAPGLVLLAAGASVALSLPALPQLGQALIPEMHQGRFTARLAHEVGTPLTRSSDSAAQVEKAIASLEGVEHVHTVVGTERRADSSADEGEHTSRLMIQLSPGGDLLTRENEVMESVREIVQEISDDHEDVGGLQVQMERPQLFTFDTPIEVVLHSTSLDRLQSSAEMVRAHLQEQDGLLDVRSSMLRGFPEVQVHYQRDLLEHYGLDTGTVAALVRDKVQGTEATRLSRGDGQVSLIVRLDAEDRRSESDIRRINVNPEVRPVIPLEAIATFEQDFGPSEIRRVDQRRAAAVSANVEGFDISGQGEAVQASMAELDLDGVEWSMGGQSREMQRSLESLSLALALAVFLVYVIMASTFESILHPFVILFSVPLALVGVVGALTLTGTPISVVVFIGSIVLAGVVVNNAIVLVDTINRIRDRGVERMEAIHRASMLRLRPILITTTTTVLGLVPLALGAGEGAEIQQPLAITIISGLSSATLLTLVVIPVVYLVLTRLLERRVSEP
jgi:HAE1 family hydrophobic/amphiphilic exporter-1